MVFSVGSVPRLSNEDLRPGGITGPPCSWGNINISWGSLEWLRWRGPAGVVNDSPILSSERMLHKDYDRKGLALVVSLKRLGAKTNRQSSAVCRWALHEMTEESRVSWESAVQLWIKELYSEEKTSYVPAAYFANQSFDFATPIFVKGTFVKLIFQFSAFSCYCLVDPSISSGPLLICVLPLDYDTVTYIRNDKWKWPLGLRHGFESHSRHGCLSAFCLFVLSCVSSGLEIRLIPRPRSPTRCL
jgi:hypothetical protein